MRIAAHTQGGYGGVPQSVGQDFETADEQKAAQQMPARKKLVDALVRK